MALLFPSLLQQMPDFASSYLWDKSHPPSKVRVRWNCTAQGAAPQWKQLETLVLPRAAWYLHARGTHRSGTRRAVQDQWHRHKGFAIPGLCRTEFDSGRQHSSVSCAWLWKEAPLRVIHLSWDLSTGSVFFSSLNAEETAKLNLSVTG